MVDLIHTAASFCLLLMQTDLNLLLAFIVKQPQKIQRSAQDEFVFVYDFSFSVFSSN